MHVLAIALHYLMKKENFGRDNHQEHFRDFLIRMIRSGELAAGKIKKSLADRGPTRAGTL